MGRRALTNGTGSQFVRLAYARTILSAINDGRHLEMACSALQDETRTGEQRNDAVAQQLKRFRGAAAPIIIRIAHASMVHGIGVGSCAQRRRVRRGFGHPCHRIRTSGARYLWSSSARQLRSTALGLCATNANRTAGRPTPSRLFTRAAGARAQLAQALPRVSRLQSAGVLRTIRGIRAEFRSPQVRT
jgi:hypothetical protein